jgi:hypothetical protein
MDGLALSRPKGKIHKLTEFWRPLAKDSFGIALFIRHSGYVILLSPQDCWIVVTSLLFMLIVIASAFREASTN